MGKRRRKNQGTVPKGNRGRTLGDPPVDLGTRSADVKDLARTTGYGNDDTKAQAAAALTGTGIPNTAHRTALKREGIHVETGPLVGPMDAVVPIGMEEDPEALAAALAYAEERDAERMLDGSHGALPASQLAEEMADRVAATFPGQAHPQAYDRFMEREAPPIIDPDRVRAALAGDGHATASDSIGVGGPLRLDWLGKGAGTYDPARDPLAHGNQAGRMGPDGQPYDQRRRTAVAADLGDIAALGSAPPVRTAADVAALRNWLVEQWRDGRPFAKASLEQFGRPSEARAERAVLQRSSLWWVSEAMTDLLVSVAPSTPDDVRPGDLPSAGRQGFVVFARPITGSDSQRDGVEVRLDALLWNHASVGGVPCLSTSWYRILDFDDGLDGYELDLAAAQGALAYGTRGETRTEPDTGRVSAMIHGTAWCPLGRSDWPLTDRLDQRPFPEMSDVAMSSYMEDRRLIAALWTLLEQRGVAERETVHAARPVRRAGDRAGSSPSEVVVVTLRRPKVVRSGEEAQEPPRRTDRTHRWFVREHLRWQACGPGRTERRLTLVRAHIRGPEDKPLITKTRVNAWVR